MLIIGMARYVMIATCILVSSFKTDWVKRSKPNEKKLEAKVSHIRLGRD